MSRKPSASKRAQSAKPELSSVDASDIQAEEDVTIMRIPFGLDTVLRVDFDLGEIERLPVIKRAEVFAQKDRIISNDDR